MASTLSPSRVARRGFEFEDIVADLLRQKLKGDRVKQYEMVGGREVDLILEHKGRRTPVQVSTGGRMPRLRAIAQSLKDIEESDLSSPIIVVGEKVTDEAKTWAQEQYSIEIWDLDYLLDAAGPFPGILDRLHQYSKGVGQREVSSGKTNAALLRSLAGHIAENTLTPADYESLCMSVCKDLFAPHLYGFERQTKTSDSGNRYDFICRIQAGSSFWDNLRLDFKTRAILFECKNYNEEIGPDQVYSTERYLFSGALRTVCLLISRLGPNAGAIRAAQGAMRESGKLLILLSNADLIQMLKLKHQEGAVEEFLDKRIWDFIISLPR